MSNFDYKDKSAPKLTDEFKKKFSVNIKGKDAIKLEGLTAFAHEKGIWKFETDIIQFPGDQNGWTAICKTIYFFIASMILFTFLFGKTINFFISFVKIFDFIFKSQVFFNVLHLCLSS